MGLECHRDYDIRLSGREGDLLFVSYRTCTSKIDRACGVELLSIC